MKFAPVVKSLGWLALGVGIGFAGLNLSHTVCSARYEKINSELACGQKQVINKAGYAQTQNHIENYFASQKAEGRIIRASMYFRDLKDGPVFGVNETYDFTPASLLKLPLAIAILNETERNPGILSVKIANTGQKLTQNIKQKYIPSKTLELGREYTIEELLQHMLRYSDNTSYELLEQFQFKERPGNLEAVYIDLGITLPVNAYTEIVSVRRYSGIFRGLYNVSFLNPALSESLLSWLSASDFKQGLVAGIPSNVPVAHKFGERGTLSGSSQLHDCGIIYYPDNPYLLCVMTEGYDLDALVQVLSSVSKSIYNEVNSRRL